MKKIIAVILALVLMLPLAGCGNKEEAASAEKEARTADGYNTVEEGGLSFQLPDYFGEPSKDGDVSNYYAEKGNGLTVIQFFSFDGLMDEADMESDGKNIYDSYVSGLTDSNEVTDFQDKSADEVELANGLKAMFYTYTFTMSGVDCVSLLTMINNPESNMVVGATLTQSSESEYDYIDAYTEMVENCEVVAGEPKPSSSGDASAGDDAADADSATDTDSAEADTSDEDSSDEDSAEADKSKEDSSDSDSEAISPEFKKTMDDYEAWFDHYCEVMKKYKEDSSNLELLSEMTDLLSEETEMLEQMENMDQSEMNNAELAYYIDVTARIEKKLLEVAY